METDWKRPGPWAVVLLVGLVLSLFFIPFDTGGFRCLKALFDFGHVPVFAGFAAGILMLRKRQVRRRLTPADYILAGLVAFGLGFLIECLQLLAPTRDFELGDLRSDALGASAMLATLYVRRRKGTPPIVRHGVPALFAVLVFLAFLPVVTTTADDLEMRRDFPLIASFERPGEIHRWRTTECTIERVSEHATDGRYALEARLRPAPFSGFGAPYLVRDWRGYRDLSFDVFLAGDEPLEVAVRIDDRAHVQSFSDRYNATFPVRPGPNRIRIPLEDVRTAPDGRQMDLSAVTLFAVFVRDLEEERVLYVDNLRLAGR